MVEWFGRPEIETDEARERRTVMEIVVDVYDEQERAIGWYYYLEGEAGLPFLAQCAARRSTSPLDRVRPLAELDRRQLPTKLRRSAQWLRRHAPLERS